MLLISPKLTAQTDGAKENAQLSEYEYNYEDEYDYDDDGSRKRIADKPPSAEDSIDDAEDSEYDSEPAATASESKDALTTGFQLTADPEQLKGKFFVDYLGRPHPLSTYPFSTQRLMMYAKLPTSLRLSECFDELVKLGQTMRSREAMLQAQTATTGAVQQNPTFHHWCFYFSVDRINKQLEATERAASLNEQATQFTYEMKGLWVLSRSLDEATGIERYFTFLRTRYIEVSQEYFARKLNILKEPLGSPP